MQRSAFVVCVANATLGLEAWSARVWSYLLFHCTVTVDSPKWTRARMLYMNHKKHRAFFTVVVAVFPMSITSGLFSLSIFINLNTYFLPC